MPLLLALGAVMGAAAGDDDALDGSLADIAVGVGWSVDAVLELEKTFFDGGVNVIRDRGAAEGDGLLQDSLHGRVESLELVAGELSGAATGTNAGSVKGFIGVDVADTVKQL